MRFKKFTAFILTIILIISTACFCVLGEFSDLGMEKSRFVKGEGPKVDGFTIDYRYYSPVKDSDTAKYPLVIWLHGMWNGTRDGKQLSASDIAAWAKPEYQSRFKDSGGAFIMAPRSVEERFNFWGDNLIRPLKATIDDFIAKNSANIDISRIYIGGYSMGGKMTLKMAVAYPEMFAAIFPICPKWVPNKAAAEKISNTPIWLTASSQDFLINYYSEIIPTWEVLMSESNIPQICRFSTMKKTVFPNGSPTPTVHDSWYAVNYDLFSDTGGDYPTLKTINGNGDEIKLTYPDGMISWLSGFKSNYDGSTANGKGNSEAYKANSTWNIFVTIYNFFNNLFRYA